LPGTGEFLGNGEVSLALVDRCADASTARPATLVPRRSFMMLPKIGLI
jgi:hypothetical protein